MPIFQQYGKIAVMNIFDTHAHFPEDPHKIPELLERASAAGVSQLMAVGGSTELNRSALQAASAAKTSASAPDVRLALGLDRDQVGSACSSCPKYDFSIVIDNRKSLSAIGEIGLDFHYSPETSKAQCDLFAAQLELAKELDLPVVIHTRDADDATLGVLDENDFHNGIIHCFTGSVPFERKLLDRGFMISISGIVTFRAAENVREAARYAPDDRLLIETDSPFLAPVPMRGTENEPSFLPHTLKFLAEQRNTSPEALAVLTTENARRILKC
jgi:TatD DNase family protein